MSVTARLQAMQPTDVGVPGPTSLDMARAFRSVRRDPLTFLEQVSAQHGDTVSFPVPGPPALLLNRPDDVRHVLQSSARSWSKRTIQYGALARVTGQGLLASAEPSWIEHRRTAAPAFHRDRLEAISEQVRAAADDALASGLGHLTAQDAAVVDVAALTQRVGLDVVGRALFSADLSPDARRLLDATSAAADLVVRLGRSVLPTAAWTPTPLNLRLRLTRRRLDAVTARLVDDRRRADGGRGGPRRDDDLLGLLLDSDMSDAEVRDELVTMVIAGHETVAAALAWTCMLLAQHPSAQDGVRDELAGLGRPVTVLDQRDRIPWTRAVVDEALRLYPPAWAISRRSLVADEVAGREVPAGTLAIISPWVLHRRAELWDAPHAFRPERFLDGRTSRPGYLPFGLGPRLCIGRELALGEMVVVLDRLLGTHRLSLPTGWRQPAPHAGVAVHPEAGMPLVVSRAAGSGRA